MPSYAQRPKYENKRPTLVLADRDHGLRDVDDRVLDQLTSVLRLVNIHDGNEHTLTGDVVPGKNWLNAQHGLTSGLDPELRRSTSLFTRAAVRLGKRGVPFCPGGANLCSHHQELDPRIIRNLLAMVTDECTVRSDRFRNATVSVDSSVRAWLTRLQSVTAIWLGEDLYTKVYGPSHAIPTLRHLKDRCEACMLSVVGGDYQILGDLYTSLLARQGFVKEQKNGHKYRSPRLLRIVQSWMAHCPSETQRRLDHEAKALSQKILSCRRAIAEHESRACTPKSSSESTNSRYVVLTRYGVSVPYPSDWYSARLAALVKANATASRRVARTLRHPPLLDPVGKRLRRCMGRRLTIKNLKKLGAPLAKKAAAIKQDLAVVLPARAAAASRSTIGTNHEPDNADNTSTSSRTLVEDDRMSTSSMSVASARPEPLRLRRVPRRITDKDRIGHSPSVQSLAGVIGGDDLISPFTKLSCGDLSAKSPTVVCMDRYVPAPKDRAADTAIKRKPVPSRAPLPLPLNTRLSESGLSKQLMTTPGETNWAPSTIRMLPDASSALRSYPTHSITNAGPSRASSTASRRQHLPFPSPTIRSSPLAAPNRPTADIARGDNLLRARHAPVDQVAPVRTARHSDCGPGTAPSSWM